MSEKELVEIVAGITDVGEMERFLHEILTDKERHVLALRWKLLKDLHAGRTQRSIAADYRISLCKITRGSKILKEQESIIRRILDERGSKTPPPSGRDGDGGGYQSS
ncbi:MAG: trp operon repressor [Syntrophales bacterium]|nr:trp operon repressor [Syntrophales bacterium]MCK9528505.1 trp operon repressor [Syntrophales bacterium]MDX9923042.1 Trp family transcriptional regulator [Syntrophales bacterium]